MVAILEELSSREYSEEFVQKIEEMKAGEFCG